MLVDRTGLGVPGVAAGGLVSFALVSTSASSLLATVSAVSNVGKAKFEAISSGELWCCWLPQGPGC